MANVTAKTSSNIFYKARCEAATHNEQLSSREGAADYMSIDRGRLYRIESGKCAYRYTKPAIEYYRYLGGK